MKTTTIILATLLILQVNSLFANNDGVPVFSSAKEMSLDAVLRSAPATPKEATFEDFSAAAWILTAAPATPKEATFEESAEVFDVVNLAPVTPGEADFNDSEPEMNSGVITLSPVTPAEADFTDLP
ncbi:MAG: hypothetical protein NTW10_04670 [Bacteroidetes bacterium]|nr:hypothetical protein [Bacteroidota bacterium]